MGALMANLELLFLNVLLLVMLFCFNLRYWKPKIFNSLSAIYICTILGSFTEALAFISDGHVNLIWLNYLSNLLYLSTICGIGACDLIYCSTHFPKPLWKTKKQYILWMLPAFIEICLLVSTPWTNIIFNVDAAGFYHRGDRFYLQLIPYGYLLVTTFYGIYWYMKSQTTKERHQYIAIAMFAIPPFILGGIQLAVPANSLDIMMFSITVSLIAHYAVSQNNRITRDTLTRLPNREVLDVVLVEKMANGRKNMRDKLYVLMGDLDGFKNINDTYGHVEGDHALVTVADALYAVGVKHKGTAARFGGDEFVIVVEGPDESTPERIIQEINTTLQQLSEKEKYVLRMSTGYTCYRTGDTVTDILKAADRELYRVKKENKSAR